MTIATILFIVCGAMLAAAALFCTPTRRRDWIWMDVVAAFLIGIPVACVKIGQAIKKKFGI